MWYQCLHRVAHGLVAVMVIAGSLALLSCSGDDDNNTASSTTGATLDPAQTRTNVDSTNVATLANQDITIDAGAFAFDTLTAPASATLQITNIRQVVVNPAAPPSTTVVPVVTGPAPTSEQFFAPLANVQVTGTGPLVTTATPLATYGRTAVPPNTVLAVATAATLIPLVPQPPAGTVLPGVACPSNLPTLGTALNPLSVAGAANPTAAADYVVNRSDGTTFAGTLCIGAGTSSAPGGPPGQGGNICVFTNFNELGSPSPGAQSIYSTCRIAVGVSPQQFVPVNTGLPGTLQLTVSQPRTGVTFTSQALSVTVSVSNNGNGTGSVFVNGIPTDIEVALATQTQ